MEQKEANDRYMKKIIMLNMIDFVHKYDKFQTKKRIKALGMMRKKMQKS